tara:strand:- start:3417 stop:4580 length:1164 start_codon:yes stop_codon:yes gene_type:complete
MQDVDLELAMELGRIYRGNEATLPTPVPEDISSVLKQLDASFSSLDKMYDFVCNTPYFQRSNPMLVAFFAQYPMDNIFLLLHSRPEMLLCEAWVHEMLETIRTAFQMTVMVHERRFHERFFIGIPIVDALCRTYPTPSTPPPCLQQCLYLLGDMCCMCQDMVRDKYLFRHLAAYIEHPQHREGIISLIEMGELYMDTSLVEDIFISCMTFMARRRPTEDVFLWVERILRSNMDFRTEHYVVHTFELWRTGWPVEIGPVLAHLLDTSNVTLVVEWETKGKLKSLIHASQEHKTIEWRAVRGLIRYLYPACVRLALNEAYVAPPDADRTECTCPITLEYIVNPVIISDGHTYERDAIMRHFASSGFVSPLTRQRVAPYVFTNRVAVSGS